MEDCVKGFHRFEYNYENKTKDVRAGNREEQAHFTILNNSECINDPIDERKELDVRFHEYEQGKGFLVSIVLLIFSVV